MRQGSKIRMMENNSNSSNRLINIAANIFYKNVLNSQQVYTQAPYLELRGNHTYELTNDLGTNEKGISVRATHTANLITNNFKIYAQNFELKTNSMSNFGVSQLKIDSLKLNDTSKSNLQNSDVEISNFLTLINGNQNVKNITFKHGIESIINTNNHTLSVQNLILRNRVNLTGNFIIENLNVSNYRVIHNHNNNANNQITVNNSFIYTPIQSGYTLDIIGANNTVKSKINFSSNLNEVTLPNSTFQNIELLSNSKKIYASFDKGNNSSNIIFDNQYSSKTYYRIGGSGNWYDESKWSLTSGGIPANEIPSRFDDAIFDENSGFTSNSKYIETTLASETEIRNMIWSNVPDGSEIRINKLINNDYNNAYKLGLGIYGSLVLHKNMNINSNGFTFLSYSNTQIPAYEFVNPTNPSMVNELYKNHRHIATEGNYVQALYFNELGNYYILPKTENPGDGYDLDLDRFRFRALANIVGHNLNVYVRTYGFFSGYNYDFSGTNFETIIHTTTNTFDAQSAYFNFDSQSPINIPNATFRANRILSSNPLHTIETIESRENVPTLIVNSIKAENLKTLQRSTFRMANSVGLVINNFINDRGSEIILANNSTTLTINNSFQFINVDDCSPMISITRTPTNGDANESIIFDENVNADDNFLIEVHRTIFNRIKIKKLNSQTIFRAIRSANNGNTGVNSGIEFLEYEPKNFYWVSGGGNWTDESHWSTVSGSTSPEHRCGYPTEFDNAIFDLNSGFLTGGNNNVNLHDNSNVRSIHDMIWNAPNNPKLISTNNNNPVLNVTGDLTFQENLLTNSILRINVNAGTTENPSTIITAGNTFFSLSTSGHNKIINNGNPDLEYDFTVTNFSVGSQSFTFDNVKGLITNTFGALNNASTLKILNSELKNNNTFTIKTNLFDLIDSIIQGYMVEISLTTKTNEQNSTINTTNLTIYTNNNVSTNLSNVNILGGNLHFNSQGSIKNLTLKSRVTNTYLNTTSEIRTTTATIENFNIESANNVKLLTNLNVTKKLNFEGVSCGQFPTYFDGQNFQISLPNAQNNPDFVNSIINNARVQRLTILGGLDENQLPIGATNSIDLGFNSGFNFANEERTLYWIGGPGNWNDLNHWSLNSGGLPLQSCQAPSSKDNAIFDHNSGLTNSTNNININLQESINSLTVLNVDRPHFFNKATTSAKLNIFGDINLQSNTSATLDVFSMKGRTNVQPDAPLRKINTNDVNLNLDLNNDQYELISNSNGDLHLNNVSYFKTNNHRIKNFLLLKVEYTQTPTEVPTLDFGQSVLTGGLPTNNQPVFGTDPTNYDYPAASDVQIINPNRPIKILAHNAEFNIYSLNINAKIYQDNKDAYGTFGKVNIIRSGLINTNNEIFKFKKIQFEGGHNQVITTNGLRSATITEELYLQKGRLNIATGQIITKVLQLSGTPCNRTYISQIGNAQTLITLTEDANYYVSYTRIQGFNFSRPINSYGYSNSIFKLSKWSNSLYTIDWFSC